MRFSVYFLSNLFIIVRFDKYLSYDQPDVKNILYFLLRSDAMKGNILLYWRQWEEIVCCNLYTCMCSTHIKKDIGYVLLANMNSCRERSVDPYWHMTFAACTLQECYFGWVLTLFCGPNTHYCWTVWSGFVSPIGIQFTPSKATPWYKSKHTAVGHF